MKCLGIATIYSLLFFNAAYAETEITYSPIDFHTAQISFSAALETAKGILESPVCQEAIEESLGKKLPEKVTIPINLVNTIYWGDLSGDFISLHPWDNPTKQAANTICARTVGGETISYINVTIDTVLTSTFLYLTYVIAHETLHYYQCESGYLWDHSTKKSHKEIINLLEESCHP